MTIVSDQIGSPTYSEDLSKLIVSIINSEKYGIYHATNEGFCSWGDLAAFALRIKNIECKINLVSSNEYKSKAIRPLNSRLSKKSLLDNGFSLLPNWQDAVERYLGNK